MADEPTKSVEFECHIDVPMTPEEMRELTWSEEPVSVTPIVNEDSGETGPRFYRVRIWSPTGEMHEFGVFWENTERSLKWVWSEHNYGCDCNRQSEWARAVYPEDHHHADAYEDGNYPCGDDNFTVEIWNPRTKKVVLGRGEDYYWGYEDPSNPKALRISNLEPECKSGERWVVRPCDAGLADHLRHRKLENCEIADDVDKADPAFQLWIRQTLNVRLNPEAL